MTEPSEVPRDRKEALGDHVWARWRWLLALVVIVFALNSFAGLIAGGLGVIAFAHRVAGGAIRAQRLAQQVRQVVADSSDE